MVLLNLELVIQIYQVPISTTTISTITDKIIDRVNNALDNIYPFLYLDTIHYKIKDGNKYIPKTVYQAISEEIIEERLLKLDEKWDKNIQIREYINSNYFYFINFFIYSLSLKLYQ